MQVTFRPDGSVEYVSGEANAALVADIATVTKRRASHIEPVSIILRIAFWFVRSVAADASAAAGWTRRWPCLWRVRIVDGPTFGAFRDRGAAIEAEIEWLQENRL